MLKLLKALVIGAIGIFGLEAPAALAATPYDTVLANAAGIQCATNVLCEALTNIRIANVTLSGSVGTGFYSWANSCPASPDGISYIQPSGTSGCFVLAGFAAQTAATPSIIVSNIPALEALAGQAAGALSYVQGYNAAGDGGGGAFIAVAGASAGDSCVNFPGIGGIHWVRQLNGRTLSVLDCGAYNDNSHATETQAAFQNGTNYILLTASATFSNLSLRVPAGMYNLGTGAFGVQNNAGSGACVLYLGEGINQTVINYSPSAEGAAFLFNSANGQCYNGGAENMRVHGNSNTIACEFLSSTQAHCNVQGDSVGMVALWCSCTPGGFSEDDTIQIQAGTTVTKRYGEFRSNNGGTGSFRHSGTSPESFIGESATSLTELFLIDSGSQLYSCPLNLSVNWQPGSAGGTLALLRNNSTNTPSCYGSIQLEVDGATNPAIFELVGAGALFYSGALQTQITGTGQLVYGNIIWAEQAGQIGGLNSFKNAYVFLENAASAVQYLTAGTGASTTVNISVSGTTNLYNLSIYNATTYNWSGQVLVRCSGLGSCNAGIVSGQRWAGSNDPTFTATSSGKLIITVADTVVANSTRIFGVVSIAGESN